MVTSGHQAFRVKPSEIPRVPTPFGLAPRSRPGSGKWRGCSPCSPRTWYRNGTDAHRYRLRAIGLGLGASVNGHDTVLTTATAEQCGLTINFIEKQTLDTGYEIQQQSRVVVHGSTFALVDTPVTFRCGSKNRMVRFRYALVVDSHTGQLDVFCWRIGAEGGECADLSRAVLLAPNTIDEAELLVDLTGFNKGIPNELGFGVDDLPPHRLEVVLPQVNALWTRPSSCRRAPPSRRHQETVAKVTITLPFFLQGRCHVRTRWPCSRIPRNRRPTTKIRTRCSRPSSKPASTPAARQSLPSWPTADRSQTTEITGAQSAPTTADGGHRKSEVAQLMKIRDIAGGDPKPRFAAWMCGLAYGVSNS